MGWRRARRVHARRSGHDRPPQINVLNVCTTSALCLVVMLLVALLVAPLLGYRILLIKSGSMAPALGVGDLVIDVGVHPTQVRPGQVVSFQDRALDSQLVTHRVVSVHRSGDEVNFVTEGDANRVTEHWSVPVNGSIGRAVVSDPGIGRLLRLVSVPVARVLAVAVTALCLASLGIGRIWRKPDARVA